MSGGGRASTRAEVASNNDSLARLCDFQQALLRVQRAAENRNISEAQSAVKSALEAIHELDDCAKRGEWTQASWTPQDVETWRGHIGARNAAHHESAHAVHLVTGSAHTPSRDDLHRARELPPIDRAGQVAAYKTRLASKRVVSSLAAIDTLLSRSILSSGSK